jgi:hypothetical protein
MNKPISPAAGSGLRQRFAEDMMVRGFSGRTRRYCLRIVAGFAAFRGRSPDTATGEDIHRLQVHPPELGTHARWFALKFATKPYQRLAMTTAWRGTTGCFAFNGVPRPCGQRRQLDREIAGGH